MFPILVEGRVRKLPRRKPPRRKSPRRKKPYQRKRQIKRTFIVTGIRSIEEGRTIIGESTIIVALPDSLRESSEDALAYIAD